MSTALTILKKLQSIDVSEAAARAVSGTEDTYKTLLQDQLLHGKGADGQDLTPGYLEDPYFKSPAAAKRYADWKKLISPNVGRNYNAPNLYINGQYHESINVIAEYSGIKSTSSAYFGIDIEGKYRGNANILGSDWRADYLENFIRPRLISNVKSYLQ